MFADNLTLLGGDTPATGSFAKVTNGITDGAMRVLTTAPLSQPCKLTIRHSSSGKGTEQMDRHLISLTKVVPNGATTATDTVNVTFSTNRNIADATRLTGMLQYILYLLGGTPVPLEGPEYDSAVLASVNALLRGES